MPHLFIRLRNRPRRPGAALDANALEKPAATPPAPASASAGAPAPAVSAETAAPRAAAAPMKFEARGLLSSGSVPVIVSSNPASRWRIVDGGDVERSSDGGSTWQTQKTGVTETLTAGSSPSPSVCWLVGPHGIVLLSTDDRSWRRVAFPEEVALAAVSGIDDQTATVTTADGRTFATSDAGRTWSRP